jgi:YHS domain-containing protein
MKKNVYMIGTLLSIISIIGSGIASGESKAYLHSYNVPSSGLAIDGYSPVSYFSKSKAVKGRKEFSAEYNGLTYHLASSREKDEFLTDPAKYVPAYGGWCAFGMAVEDKFPIDPKVFKIVDGRLFLFLKNPAVDALKLWDNGKEAELVKKAEAHWKKVAG